MRIRSRYYMPALVIAAALFGPATALAADTSKSDYITPAFTYSPDNQFGVMIPVVCCEETSKVDNRKNKVEELGTRSVVIVIDAAPGYNRQLNFRKVATPRWSSDSSVLLWKVEGKWCPNALVLLKFEQGKSLWQLNLLKASQAAILSRTQKTTPDQYALVKKSSAGKGSNYPDGFTIDVYTDDENTTSVALPLTVHVALSANPAKYPNLPNLDAWLNAVVTEDGKFVVKNFKTGTHNHWR